LMADRIYFVDAAIPADKKKRGKSKSHMVFDGSRVFRVRRLTELEDAGEVYVDAMFPQIHEELMELIEKGVKVFLLRDTRILKRLREENHVRKSDEADARILSIIPRNHFRQLTIREVRLLKLIGEYEMYVRWGRIIRQWIRICPLDSFKESVKELRRITKQYARKIIEEIESGEGYATTYRLACDMLGVRDSVEVAILVAMLPLNRKFGRLRGLLGLTPNKDKNYNHRLRGHLSSLAAAIYINNRRCGVGAGLFEGINRTPRGKALYTLQLRILKILKRAWQQRQRMLAGGQ